MKARFIIHRHSAGRSHFDLRLLYGDRVRSWSLLRIPPVGAEQRLAIEREELNAEDLERETIHESAFGAGRAVRWDEGEAGLVLESEDVLVLQLNGRKLSGRYELKRMDWYPGNRWLLRRAGAGEDR